MYELHRITLQNEMDLILVHKRSMKLAELAGISLPAQTTFATAISEMARWALEYNSKSCLVLQADVSAKVTYLVASINDEDTTGINRRRGLEYAKKLVSKYQISTADGGETSIDLFYAIPPSSSRIDLAKVDEWRMLFRNERPISPYEELKIKNEQLQDLANKIQKSELQYKTLTNALPQIIFSLDTDGRVTYANEWLDIYLGKTLSELLASRWEDVVHPADYSKFTLLISDRLTASAFPVKTQCRLRNAQSGEYLWHLISISPIKNDREEISNWIGYMVDIHAQRIVEQTMEDNRELSIAKSLLLQNQATLEETIQQLNRSNHELQQFAYVASHDLQEPLRKVLYYTDYLLSKYASAGVLDDKSVKYLLNIQKASERMRNLILDLLKFSQLNRMVEPFVPVDLDEIAREVTDTLLPAIEAKQAAITFQNLPRVSGSKGLLFQLFQNLIINSIKFNRPGVPPNVHIHAEKEGNFHQIIFDDNGIGFDVKHIPNMFELFQRLHGQSEYEGSGIGLTICKKISELHQGTITATLNDRSGARFIVSIPAEPID